MMPPEKNPAPESRFSIAEVPDQLSKMFFGNGNKQDQTYSSFGSPTAPTNQFDNNGLFQSPFGGSSSNNNNFKSGSYNNDNYYYNNNDNYNNNNNNNYNANKDTNYNSGGSFFGSSLFQSLQPPAPTLQPSLEQQPGSSAGCGWSLQLGQAGIIAFIVFAAVIVVFLVILSCLYCTGRIGKRRRQQQQQQQQQQRPQPQLSTLHRPEKPPLHQSQSDISEDYEKTHEWPPMGGLSRSAGLENLNTETETSIDLPYSASSSSEESLPTLQQQQQQSTETFVRNDQQQQQQQQPLDHGTQSKYLPADRSHRQPQVPHQPPPTHQLPQARPSHYNQVHKHLQQHQPQHDHHRRPSWLPNLSAGINDTSLMSTAQTIPDVSYSQRHLPVVPQIKNGNASDRPMPYYEVPLTRLDLAGQSGTTGDYSSMTRDKSGLYSGGRKDDQRNSTNGNYV